MAIGFHARNNKEFNQVSVILHAACSRLDE